MTTSPTDLSLYPAYACRYKKARCGLGKHNKSFTPDGGRLYYVGGEKSNGNGKSLLGDGKCGREKENNRQHSQSGTYGQRQNVWNLLQILLSWALQWHFCSYVRLLWPIQVWVSGQSIFSLINWSRWRHGTSASATMANCKSSMHHCIWSCEIGRHGDTLGWI